MKRNTVCAIEFIITRRVESNHFANFEFVKILKIGHIIYIQTRLDDTNTVASISLLYLYAVEGYVPKKII